MKIKFSLLSLLRKRAANTKDKGHSYRDPSIPVLPGDRES